MYRNMFSKRNKNGNENSDCQSFGRKLEVNCKKVFLKVIKAVQARAEPINDNGHKN